MNITLELDSIIWGIQYRGGISNYWKNILGLLCEQDSISARLILPRSIKYSEYSDDLVKGVEVYRELLSTSFARYCDVLNSGNSEIFHSSYYRTPAFSNQKYVVTAYDFIYERYSKGPRLWLHTHQKARSLHKADVVICISDATKKDVIRFFPQIKPSKLKTIYLGVEHSKFYPDVGDILPNFSDVVLFVGLRGGYKRFDLAVSVIAACAGLRLGIVGPPLTLLEVGLLNLNIPGRWVFYGAVNGDSLRQLYSGAFAFIFPSDFEGFGLPVLEAMACGCPVIASNRGSIPEVGGEFVAYAFDQTIDSYASHLTLLRQSNNFRSDLISGGVGRAKHFTWENTCKSTLEAYSDILD
jgi:mannosyltransferase